MIKLFQQQLQDRIQSLLLRVCAILILVLPFLIALYQRLMR